MKAIILAIVASLTVPAFGQDVIWAPDNSSGKIDSVAVSSPAVVRDAQRLGDIRKIFVGSLGNGQGSELIRQKLINRLIHSGVVSVTESVDSADAALTGVGELNTNLCFNAYGGRTRMSASAAIHLVSRDGQILWGTENRSSILALNSVTSSVADKVAKDLINAISQDRQLGTAAPPIGQGNLTGATNKPIQSSSFGQPVQYQTKPLTDVNQAGPLVDQGKALREAGNLPDSRTVLEHACLLDPNQNSGVAHENLALTLQQLGELDLAERQYRIALRFASDVPRIYYNLACCYVQMGKVDQAISFYYDYLSRDPSGQFSNESRRLISSLQSMHEINDKTNTSDYFESATSSKIARWPFEKQPIKVFIESGEKVRGYSSILRQALIQAFDQWTKATSYHISWELVSNKEGANIVCHWISDRNNFRQSVGAEGGQSYVTWLPDPHHVGEYLIATGDMTLCTIRLDGKTVLTQQQARAVCLHEVGHILGLSGHSPNNNDIMFFAEGEYPKTDLSDRDKATINHLYPPSYCCQNSGTTR